MPPLNIDSYNAGISETILDRPVAGPGAAFEVAAVNNGAVAGLAGGTAIGVSGVSSQGIGVSGASTDGTAIEARSTTGMGVDGGSNSAYGVKGGSGTSAGVYGVSLSGEGVIGRSLNGPAVGVYGGSPTTGVLGSGASRGVQGQAASGIGVEGVSSTGLGVRGITSGLTRGQAGVVGINKARGGLAGLFYGSVNVTADLTVYGGLYVAGPKSAAVRLPDGSERLLYAMESPEAWFEDFGRSKLSKGHARVNLDSKFAATVRTSDYHVFLTPEGNSQGLYVSARTRVGFEIREQKRGTSNIEFSYRVVARRKDIDARRFEKIAHPDTASRFPQPVTLPEPPLVRAADEPSRPGRMVVAALRKARRLRASRARRRT